MKRSYLLLLILTSAITFGCSPANNSSEEMAAGQVVNTAPSPNPTVSPSGNPKTREYSKSLEELRVAFNRDKGKVRLLTLLSPT
jgi:hypothetical protein